MLSLEQIIAYQASPNLLQDRIILITGAGDGIGKAAAISCAALGAKVILAGRTLAKLEQVFDQIVVAGGAEPVIYPVDLEGASTEDYDELALNLDQQFGRLDGLLQNAAILGQRTPLSNYRQDVWDRVMQVNVTAQFKMTQALMPVLEKSADASILFTTSSVGRQGRAFWGAYAVSKFATEGMMQTWAAELEGLGSIRVNAVNPGATRTQMRAQAFPAENPDSLKTAEDIMPAYLYLLGPDSASVNGQSIDAQIR
ncbi:MAG: YciK family oxidoreductase [Porticoccaceae bacterium]|nr:YciK family oxidoreductase [Porticoccaceae bacterium]MDA9565768.1 YciK family oxidoreductase [Porticoccaceae bacterium]MDB2554916.1 YciK family oxidoreductase [Porticoccaceae bacterium]MDG1446131.1 YciK family oxidoreductase [Porticoccaceae bacterium]